MKCSLFHITEILQTIPGLNWVISEQIRQNSDGQRKFYLEIRVNGVAHHLPEVVDTSQGPREHRVWLLMSDRDESVAIFGGLIAYWLDSSHQLASKEKLFREASDEEYWELKAVLLPRGALVVYEGGVMLLEESLKVRWHIRKRYNDSVELVENGCVHFLSETGERWFIPE